MLDKIKEKLTKAFCKVQTEVYCAAHDDQGDTNFISIIIILAIVLVVAGVFITFKNDILGSAEQAINKFKELFNRSI